MEKRRRSLRSRRALPEYSSEGLLAINRGLANTDSIVVDNENVNNNIKLQFITQRKNQLIIFISKIF